MNVIASSQQCIFQEQKIGYLHTSSGFTISRKVNVGFLPYFPIKQKPQNTL